MIKCFRCNEIKEFEQFSRCKNKTRKYCNNCIWDKRQVWYQKYREKNKESIRIRAKVERKKTAESRYKYSRELKTKKDASIYDPLFKKQNGLCAICSNPPSHNKKFAIDHNHKCCGKNRSLNCNKCVRGLLCMTCNCAIGMLNDSPELLLKAISYLAKDHD